MKIWTWDKIRARVLARNYLVRPATKSQLAQVVGDVCGIQAQMMIAAELDVSARVTGLTQADLRRALWEERVLVKTFGPRGTLHLLPADELTLWMAAMRGRGARDGTPWYEALKVKPAQAYALVDALGEALDGKCLAREELADAVAKKVGAWAREGIATAWADRASAEAAFRGALCFGPPQGSRVTFARADQWLGNWRELDPEEALREMVRRYLKAYGPATYQDFGQWFALKPPAARALFDELGEELEQVEVEGKRAWVLARDTKQATLNTLSVRLVPQYDCYVLGSRFGREQIIPEQARKRIAGYGRGPYEGAVGVPVVLMDGIVAGMWERRKAGKKMEVRVDVFRALRAAEEELQAEAKRIGEFLGMEAVLVVGKVGGE